MKEFQWPNLPEGFGDMLPKGFPPTTPDTKEQGAPKTGKARLGVNVADVDDTTRKQFNIPSGISGAVVTGVEPGSVAAKLGIQDGDVIRRVGDVTVSSGADLVKAMESVKWGDTKSISWARYGENSKFEQSRSIEFR